MYVSLRLPRLAKVPEVPIAHEPPSLTLNPKPLNPKPLKNPMNSVFAFFLAARLADHSLKPQTRKP